MLAKDLVLLIDKYDEPGIMIDTQNKIYWFNGKRFEFWCHKTSECTDIYYTKNHLY